MIIDIEGQEITETREKSLVRKMERRGIKLGTRKRCEELGVE